jgi:hypothetical protein
MTTLLALTCALVGPYVLLTLLGSVFPSVAVSPQTRAKVGVDDLPRLSPTKARYAESDVPCRLGGDDQPRKGRIVRS